MTLKNMLVKATGFAAKTNKVLYKYVEAYIFKPELAF